MLSEILADPSPTFVADWLGVCGTDLSTVIDSEPIHPAMAKRGDIVVCDKLPEIGYGVCFSSGALMRALFWYENGVVMHRARDMTAAYRV